MKLQLRADDKMPWGRYKGKTIREIYKDCPEYYRYLLTLEAVYISRDTQKLLESHKKASETTTLEYQCQKENLGSNVLEINSVLKSGPYKGRRLLDVAKLNESYFRYLMIGGVYHISHSTFCEICSALGYKKHTITATETKDGYLYSELSVSQREMVDAIFSKLQQCDNKILMFSKKTFIGFRYEEKEGESNPYWFRIRHKSGSKKIEFVLRETPSSSDKPPIEINARNLKEIYRQIDLLFAKEGSFIEQIRQQIIKKSSFSEYNEYNIRKGRLLPQQVAGAMLASKYNKFAFFYDTGTGKTILSLEIIAQKEKLDSSRFLIIAPKPLIKNGWLEDGAEYYPQLKIMPLSANITSRDIISLYNSWNKEDGIESYLDEDASYTREFVETLREQLMKRANHFVVNLQQILSPKKSEAILNKIHVNGLIVDESTTIKNHDSKSFKRIRLIAKKMQYVYLLSGKPAPNTTVEYYSQMAIVAPELFNLSFDKFVATYYKREGKYGKYEFKNGYTKSVVTKMVAEKSITVSKEQCLELPPRHFEELLVQLEDFAMIEYGKVLANFLNTIVSLDDEVITIDRISKLAQMMKLREMATGFYIDDTKKVYNMSENKLNALMDLLKKLGKNQVVIWCNFIYEIECLEKALKAWGYSVVTAYSKSKNLDDSIQRFKKNEAQIIIANSQTLKYGITFVNCKYAIYNSLSYSYDDYYQSRDRIYRFGQKSECTYYHLLSQDTIDEQIFRCLQDKHNNAVVFEKLIKSAAKLKFKIESDLIERSLEVAEKKVI